MLEYEIVTGLLRRQDNEDYRMLIKYKCRYLDMVIRLTGNWKSQGLYARQ